ncbi:MAG: DNA-binding MarR family transcriptional regulator [Marivirga sp.]|jgi:DNA-binding MarR family transcriptional regulator
MEHNSKEYKMKLSESIQHSFHDEGQRLIAEVLFTANWLDAKIAKLIEGTGLSFQQLNVLRIIAGQDAGSANVQLIKDRMISDSSNVSRLLNKLAEKQLIEKERCTNDQRVVYLQLTKAGESLMQKGKRLVESFEFEMESKKLNQLNELLEAVRK